MTFSLATARMMNLFKTNYYKSLHIWKIQQTNWIEFH